MASSMTVGNQVRGLAALAALTVIGTQLAHSQGTQAKVSLKGPFVPFGLCFSDMRAADQIKLCQKYGFTGLGLAGWSKPDLTPFVDLPEVRSGKFRIYSILWWAEAKMDLTGAKGKSLDDLLVQAGRMKTALWMVSDGTRDAPKVMADTLDTLCVVAKKCRVHGVQLVLYPHMGCVYETAEEGLAVYERLRKRGFPEVQISIHLCHELKAGNQGRLREIIAKVAPHLGLVSISGGDTDARGKGDWETAIRPLGEGTFDPHGFLKALADYGYKGPIELHTYGLPDPRKYDHIARSIKAWKSMVVNPRL